MLDRVLDPFFGEIVDFHHGWPPTRSTNLNAVTS